MGVHKVVRRANALDDVAHEDVLLVLHSAAAHVAPPGNEGRKAHDAAAADPGRSAAQEEKHLEPLIKDGPFLRAILLRKIKRFFAAVSALSSLSLTFASNVVYNLHVLDKDTYPDAVVGAASGFLSFPSLVVGRSHFHLP